MAEKKSRNLNYDADFGTIFRLVSVSKEAGKTFIFLCKLSDCNIGKTVSKCTKTIGSILMALFEFVLSPNFQTFKEPRNRFQGINSASLWSLAGRYDNPIPNRFLAPIKCLKFRILASVNL
jgi:hypothetical protein